MSRLVLIGAGGHSRAAIETAETMRRYNEIEIIDHKNISCSSERILGYNVNKAGDWLSSLDIEAEYFVSIGDATERKRVQKILESNRVRLATLCHETALVHNSSQVGSGVFIGAFAHIGPECRVGEGCIVNTHANIEHETIVGPFSHCAPSSLICGRCTIGHRVILGAGSKVIDGISVADEVTVGAGAVIIRDILQAKAVYLGVPGKKR